MIPISHSPTEISLVLCGEAGQGIQTIETILTNVLKLHGYHIFATKEYMSRIRGGSNSTEICVASNRVASYVDRIDILIPLDKPAIDHLKHRISPKTIILGDQEQLATDLPIIDIPLTKIATALGNHIFTNIVAVSVLSGLFQIDLEMLQNYLASYFANKNREIVEKNLAAAHQGYQIAQELISSGSINIQIPQNPNIGPEIIINGADAVALGAIAGGCNFVASYPMSPSTGVFTYLAQYAPEFGILVEQAEDEISAINMGLGAWYAGARAMVTTSGGGFDLMTEGLSLAGITETPMVILLAQRPGPATGLPTRTEQGDLELALYSGHGEFPRIILTPGSLSEAFSLTQKAFRFADEFQVPVFIMADQYLLDSFYNVSESDLNPSPVHSCIIETSDNYQRYELTSDGISPRGIPGFGTGLVGLDSDEHDPAGHITEDPEMRIQMVDKRLKKLESIRNAVIPPEFSGSQDYQTLVIGWGSTYHTIKEAFAILNCKRAAFLHLKQVYPLPKELASYLKTADKTVIVENNATGQLAKLIKQETGVEIGHRILKYDGFPFSVEELANKLSKIL